MKILWIINSVVLLPVADKLGIKRTNFGGWIQNMLEQVKCMDDIDLYIVTSAPNIKDMYTDTIDDVSYYVLPQKGYNISVSSDMAKFVIDTIKPDLIHSEGSEREISNVFFKISETKKLVSLQGIINGYSLYQNGLLPVNEFMCSKKIYEFVFGLSLHFRKSILFNKRLNIELDTLKRADYLVGRTYWDRAHSYFVNPEAKYYECNRILRDPFYEGTWSLNKCQKYSIFTGNGQTALKGVHNVIKAISLLKEEYKNIKLNIIGKIPNNYKSIIGYPGYIKSLIKDLKVEKYISFLDLQDANGMKEKLLKTHIYVLPSLIENSPNTLGEAMMLGVPCVSAYTGGVSQMAKDEEEALFYRANDPILLAWQIKRIFDSDDLANMLSENAQKHARITHDKKGNAEALINIYKDILGEN